MAGQMQLQDEVISRTPAAGSSRSWRPLVWFLIVVSAIYFTWRGPLRAAPSGGSGDLTVGYAAGLVWLDGGNPYDPAALSQKLQAAGAGPLGEPSYMDFMRNIYFPVALPMYLPLGVLNWTGAKWAWIILNIAAVAAIGAGLLELAEMQITEVRGLAFLALLMALAPIHSTMAMGQTGIIATALVVVAAVLERRKSPAWAGIIYGLAVAVKVQIALPFLAYVIWKRRWPTAVAGILVLAAITAISIGRMNMAGVPWYGTWMQNLVGTTTGGGHNDAGLANPGRHSMLCLPVLLFSFIDSRFAVMAITYALVLAAALFTVWRIRSRYPKQELLALSIVAVLTLLVTYHRTYDAVLLVLPLAWAVRSLDRHRERHGRIWPAVGILIIYLDFIAPIQTTLEIMRQEYRLPHWLWDNPFWSPVLLSQQTWSVIFITVLLLAAIEYGSTNWGPERRIETAAR